jgi:hypothetical protein
VLFSDKFSKTSLKEHLRYEIVSRSPRSLFSVNVLLYNEQQKNREHNVHCEASDRTSLQRSVENLSHVYKTKGTIKTNSPR